MEQSDGGHNGQENSDDQQRVVRLIWSVSYTAIAIWCWLIAVVLVRWWAYDRVPETYKAQVFIESILTLAIIDVIVVHAVMYYKQAKEANRQGEIARKQFEITDRPWLKFSAVFSQGITFNSGGGLQTQFTYKAKNVGGSVAINATITTRIVIPE
jgi:hypothetical protein